MTPVRSKETSNNTDMTQSVEAGRAPGHDTAKPEKVADAEGKPEPSSEVSLAASGHHEPVHLAGPVDFLKELYHRFNTDQCGAWAAALSFFALLSIVPLLICGIAALGFVYQDPQVAADKVQSFIAAQLPVAQRSADRIAAEMIANAGIVEQARKLADARTITGIIGVASFLWSGSRIFANAIAPMNAAFRANETRNFIKTQLYCLGLMFAVGFIFLLSLLPAAGADILRKLPLFAGLADPTPWWLDALLYLSGVAISALMYMVIYRFLPSPSAKVTWRQAFVGGATIAILWEAMKQGFAFYLRRFNGDKSYNQVYGSLGSVVIAVLWVYYSSMLLLLGAEIARLYADMRNQKAAQEKPKLPEKAIA